MNKIKEKVDEYLGFDSDIIFKIDYIRLFGGAIRDILANQPIQDLDILLGPETFKKVSTILTSNGYEYVESYTSKDVIEMYKDIQIINEPWTYMKIVNGKISMIQLIRPSRISNSIQDSILEIIWNVDFSVCAVSYDGNNLYENYPQAISECKSMIFTPLTGTLMHNSNRSYIRKSKLERRGWIENGVIDAIRRVKLESLIPDEKIEYIEEYNPKHEYKQYKKVLDDFMDLFS
jgi:hypothetical protein